MKHPRPAAWLPPDSLWQQAPLALLLLDDHRRVRYANPAAVALLQQSPEALLGQPFEIPFSLEHPVDIVIARDDGREVDLEVVAGAIRWHEQPGYHISLHDVTQRKNKLRQSLHQLDVERALSGFTTRFTQVTSFDQVISETLADVGRMTDAGCCRLFAFRQDDQLWELVQEWSEHSDPARLLADTQPPAYFLPWLTKRLMASETVHVESVLDLPPEAAREKSFLASRSTRSWLALPVYLGSDLAGCLTLDNNAPIEKWQGFDLNLLWAIAQIMGRALHHRKIEHQLEQQSAFLQQVIDLNPHMIFAKDRDGRHTLVNQAMAQFYNMPVRRLLGKTDREINPNQNEAVAFRRDDLEVMNTLQEKVIPEEACTNAHSERRCMWTVKRPILGPDGQATHVMAVATDITDRKRAEDKLRENEQRYRQLFNKGNDAVFVYHLTPEGLPDVFIEVNDIACQRLGFSREELMAKTMLDINLAADHPRILSFLQQLQHKKWAVAERTHVTGDGRLIPVEVGYHLFDLKGQPAVLSVARDISDRKSNQAERERLQAQLLQAQKMEAIGRLTGAIAHDFNNVLTAISGYAEMLQSELSSSHPTIVLADKIVDSVDRAATLVHQLLTFGRQGPAHTRLIDLNQHLGSMESILRRMIGEDVQLVLDMADKVWPVRLDPTQLEQVLLNLVINARDAMPAGGRLRIQTRNVVLDASALAVSPDMAPGDFVQIDVHDTGLGMSAEVKSHIFEPFFTTKGADRGAGFGLATVYGIISQNGGHIQVESTEGQGTTIQLFLPHADMTIDLPPDGPQPAARELPTGVETVLLVEDDGDVRHVVRQMLERQGYRVLEAADGQAAHALYTQQGSAVHLLLTDVVLPDTRGPLLAAELCRLQPDLKTLFISGYARDIVDQQGELKSGFALVTKPFTPAQLLAKVRQVLDA